MNSKSAANAYKSEAIENAPPIKIIRMLYQGALRFLDRAEAADPNDPTSTFIDQLGRADDIVAELRCSLAPEHAPEICEDLERLYLFCESEIGRAMTERSSEPLGAVRSVLVKLLEAWQKVEVQGQTQAA